MIIRALGDAGGRHASGADTPPGRVSAARSCRRTRFRLSGRPSPAITSRDRRPRNRISRMPKLHAFMKCRGRRAVCNPPATRRMRLFCYPADPGQTRVAPVPGAARATAGNAALALLLVLVVAVTLVAGAPGSRAAAAINPARLFWLVKSNDLAELNQQAAADGVSLPAFTWVGCGGKSDPLYCQPGQVPIFTSYWQLEARAKAGWRGTALFDIEPWRTTPPGQRHDPGKWICLAAQLQQTDPHLNVIITPFAQPRFLS